MRNFFVHSWWQAICCTSNHIQHNICQIFVGSLCCFLFTGNGGYSGSVSHIFLYQRTSFPITYKLQILGLYVTLQSHYPSRAYIQEKGKRKRKYNAASLEVIAYHTFFQCECWIIYLNASTYFTLRNNSVWILWIWTNHDVERLPM